MQKLLLQRICDYPMIVLRFDTDLVLFPPYLTACHSEENIN